MVLPSLLCLVLCPLVCAVRDSHVDGRLEASANLTLSDSETQLQNCAEDGDKMCCYAEKSSSYHLAATGAWAASFGLNQGHCHCFYVSTMTFGCYRSSITASGCLNNFGPADVRRFGLQDLLPLDRFADLRCANGALKYDKRGDDKCGSELPNVPGCNDRCPSSDEPRRIFWKTEDWNCHAGLAEYMSSGEDPRNRGNCPTKKPLTSTVDVWRPSAPHSLKIPVYF